jgi:hypothetical protein
MKQKIKIGGMTTDSSFKSGACYNLVNLREDRGALSPVSPRKKIYQFSDFTNVFIHKASGYKHWIGIKDGEVKYFQNDTVAIPSPVVLCTVGSNPTFTQTKNVATILSSTGLIYLIWYQSEYKVINTNFNGEQTDTDLLPVGNIELRINASSSPPTVYIADSDIPGSTSEEVVAGVIEGLFAKALSVERERGFLKGFVLACTAYELYDGSYILHSNPVVIGQSVDARTRYQQTFGGVEYDYKDNPIVAYNGWYDGIHYRNGGSLLAPYALDEERSFKLETGQANLGGGTPSYYFYKSGIWANNTFIALPNPDFSLGVDDPYWSFLADDPSLPGYQEAWEDYPEGTKFRFFYDTGSGVENMTVERKALRASSVPLPNLVGYMDAYGSGKYPAVISRRSEFQIKIEKSIPEALRPLIRTISVFITPEVLMYKNINFKRVSRATYSGANIDNYLPDLKTDAEMIEELMTKSKFYKVSSIPFDEVISDGNWVTIDLKGKLGENLKNQEEMTLDPFSHHSYLPDKQYVYNSRLHILNYEQSLFHGWPLSYFKQIGGLGQFELPGDEDVTGVYKALVYALVEIKTETGLSKVVRYNIPTGTISKFNLGAFLSYPDSRAKKITLCRETQGLPPVTERGVCWNTSGSPTVLDGKAAIGAGTGTFGQHITELARNTTYYVRSYAIADGVANYGEEKSFTTGNGIAVFTTKLPVPMASVAYTGGNITTDGGSSITARGVCWGTTTAPTTSGDKTVDGSGTGEFSSEITELDPSTTYYVRAYVVNEFGTHYGNEYSFETLSGAVDITIGDAYDITPVGAKGSITIVEFSGALDTPYGGICWSTSPNPTVDDTHGSEYFFYDYGTFICLMAGLTPGTLYYFRGYAINEFGASYSSQKTFTTLTGILDVITLDIDLLYVGDTWANVYGEVEDNYGGGVTEFGVCYSLSNTIPTIADSKVVGSGSFASFMCVLTPLIPDMGDYYARAYAINDIGTFYGAVKTFYTTP